MKLSHAASRLRTAIAELRRAIGVGSGALLGCGLVDWVIIFLNVLVFDMPQICLCLDAISLLLILFLHDTLNLAVLEEYLLLLHLYAFGTILYKMVGDPCRKNRGWHTADNRDDAIKSCVIRDRAVVNLATQWCHRNTCRWLASWANRRRVKHVNSNLNVHNFLVGWLRVSSHTLSRQSQLGKESRFLQSRLSPCLESSIRRLQESAKLLCQAARFLFWSLFYFLWLLRRLTTLGYVQSRRLALSLRIRLSAYIFGDVEQPNEKSSRTPDL